MRLIRSLTALWSIVSDFMIFSIISAIVSEGILLFFQVFIALEFKFKAFEFKAFEFKVFAFKAFVSDML